MESAVRRNVRLRHCARLAITATGPFSFHHTFGKRTLYGARYYFATPFEVFDGRTLWTGVRVDGRMPLGLRLSLAPGGREGLVVDVFAGRDLAEGACSALEYALAATTGVQDDVQAFYRTAKRFRPLRRAIAHLRGMRVTRFLDPFGGLLFAVLLQRASQGRTYAMLRHLYASYGTHIQFDGRNLLITPEPHILAIGSEQELRVRCRVGFRAKYIRHVGVAAAKGLVPDFVTLRSLTLDQAKAVLTQITGVGDHSAEVVIPHPAFPVDSWSAPILAPLLGVRSRRLGLIPALKTFAKTEFGPWQRYAYEYLVNALDVLVAPE